MAHRYWRILFRDSYHTGGEIDLGWVKFFDTLVPNPSAPISVGGTAISGENYSSSYPPSKAFTYTNGETADNWASKATTSTYGTDKWVGYDFGTAVDVKSYSMSVYGLYFPKAWDLQWSDDATAWTTADSWDTFTWNSNSSHFFQGPTTLSGPGARYWRFLFTGDMNIAGTGEQDVQEAALRTVAGGANAVTSSVLTVTSDRRYDSFWANIPRNAFDGDTDSLFATSTALTDHYLLVDFGQRMDIVEAYLKVNNAPYVRGTIKVQKSDDKVIWSDAGTFPSGWTTDQAKTLTLTSTVPGLLRRRPVIVCC